MRVLESKPMGLKSDIFEEENNVITKHIKKKNSIACKFANYM